MATDPDDAARVKLAARQAMSLALLGLPHLSGLAHTVRIVPDLRTGTAGIFASGRLVINPAWFLDRTSAERAFVIAHELLHLALHSHSRVGDSDPVKFNIAHDAIINDMLVHELGTSAPEGAINMPDARFRSVEELLMDPDLPSPPSPPPDTALATALKGARPELDVPETSLPDDVLDEALEGAWFPEESTAARSAATEATQRAATKSLVLQKLHEQARDLAVQTVHGQGLGNSDPSTAYAEALHVTYRPPWELALHRWLDAALNPRRSYSRASRRGADRTDVVLPGRVRDAMTLSIILDTSGSMSGDIAHALGSIRSFGQAVNIDAVRIVQCDTAVTSDEVVALDELASFAVSGFGGSDMTPAMDHLAADPETTAVVIITDGDILYPEHPMPYDVLWVDYGYWQFQPPYGQVIHTRADALGTARGYA